MAPGFQSEGEPLVPCRGEEREVLGTPVRHSLGRGTRTGERAEGARQREEGKGKDPDPPRKGLRRRKRFYYRQGPLFGVTVKPQTKYNTRPTDTRGFKHTTSGSGGPGVLHSHSLYRRKVSSDSILLQKSYSRLGNTDHRNFLLL